MTTTNRFRSVPPIVWALIFTVAGCHFKCAKATPPLPPACPSGEICVDSKCQFPDAGVVDAGTEAATDAGGTDAGATDAGNSDGGSAVVDAGSEEVDAGVMEATGAYCFPDSLPGGSCSVTTCNSSSDCCDAGNCVQGGLPTCAQCTASGAIAGGCNAATCATNQYCQTIGGDGTCECPGGAIALCLPNCNTLTPPCQSPNETCSPALGTCSPSLCTSGIYVCPTWETCSMTTGGSGIDIHGCTPKSCSATSNSCLGGGTCNFDAGQCAAVTTGSCQY